jgi:hypothetical protein
MMVRLDIHAGRETLHFIHVLVCTDFRALETRQL